MKLFILLISLLLSIGALASSETICRGKMSFTNSGDPTAVEREVSINFDHGLADFGKANDIGFVLSTGTSRMYYWGEIDPSGINDQQIIDAHAPLAFTFRLKVLSDTSITFQGKFMSDPSPTAYVKGEILPATLNCQ